MVELKPCPFCGSSGEELMMFCDPDEGRDNSGPSRRIQCAVCHVEAPFYPSKAEAVGAWNRRTLPPDTQLLHREENHGPTLERAAGAIEKANYPCVGDARRIASTIRAMEVKRHG